MTRNGQKNGAGNGLNDPPAPARRSVLVIVLVVGVVTVGALFALKDRGSKPAQPDGAAGAAATPGQRPGTETRVWTASRPPKIAVSEPNAAAPVPAPAASPASQPPRAE